METYFTIPTFEKSPNQLLAEEILDAAWEYEDPMKKLRSARKALNIDPLCCDAYTLLGDLSELTESKIEYYEKALSSFEQRYGQDYIKKNTGVFWFNRETRPYIRALHAYGLVCWDIGKKNEAIELYKKILELNPNDNLDVRYRLLNWLLSLRDTESAAIILKKYPEETVFMLFSTLLYSILEDPERVRHLEKEYKQAVESNPFVVPYLLGKTRLPEQVQEPVQRGSQEEAAAYCLLANQAWTASKEVLEILEIISINYSTSFPT
ncbi:ST7 protein [Sphaerochaeta pleomorpha str. Grapes]|uniref:ST7 protein n=1 Tax=Sphaerochaeta pleomorpha (strain ATCC BAA-1885 / DSM 22778 / Grapes) TaxID=158190 RepID=G8QVJ7_SPHPG|nr:tetratricopeptide repeat protein [Sphaerochaeta pleomorpha]AEV28230.1 ST7 protein [Sphaerochaeta pleomorpha str. Grapes]